MAMFAKIGMNGKVIDVQTVANEELHDSNGVEREDIGVDFLTKLTGWAIWKQSSYNTHDGIHYEPDSLTPSSDQSKAFRKNTACIGGTYDEDRDAFIPPKIHASWVLNETTCAWNAPITYPSDGKPYKWNEENQSWDLINVNP